jgi:signal transduction histidine kinase
LWEHFGDENARRAWIGVGAPILGLVVVIIALAIGAFAGFARQQDRAFAENTQRLVGNAVQGRATSLAAMMVEYANWDAAFANITTDWNERWVADNIYSSVADAMLVIRADGAVRYAWFGENVADQSALRAAAINAAVSIPELRGLASAATPGETAIGTHTILDGRWVVVAAAPVTPENDAARRRQARNGKQDFVVVVDMVDPSELATFGVPLALKSLAFTPPGETPRDMVSETVRAANGDAVGALQWRHAFPGAAAFQRQVWLVIFSLLGVGALAVLIARRLVSRQIVAISSATAALAASREKSEFLARVTSELRTPLNAVIGYAELIQEETVSPAARDDAQRIIVAARELSAMLSDIIDQSRIDVGNVRMNLEVVPVAGMLAEVQGLMHPVARAAGVEIIISQEAVAAYAFADHARLRQCLMNILGNAVKFSPRGGVVRLRARLAREDGREMIVIEVSDSGLGIAAEEMPAIFRPFSQANAAIGAVYGGAGLGLSIAHALAREMGGDISVVSARGEGSAFYLRVPTASARALSAA